MRKIIAEIGINHDGDIAIARGLIDSASKSGCYGIKFQYRNSDRMYSQTPREIGDEIIRSELTKSEMSFQDILSLAKYARSLNLKVGISCFTAEDFADMAGNMEFFDFFKVPSVELLNFSLIDLMLDTGKTTYLSLGAHTEIEVEQSLNRIKSRSNWVPMHCISNYPTALHNAKLGYISYLQNKWKREIGFSSHDEYWELNVAALALGAQVIERHITYSRTADGLDHSTSSTWEEFSRLCKIADSFDQVLLGNESRNPNQGELLNKQNLGRSYYARRDLQIGETINIEEFDYRNPQIGLGYADFRESLGHKMLHPLSKGVPISAVHIEASNNILTDLDIESAKKLNMSLPVRLHDYREISTSIPIDAFEFHLSYEEIDRKIDYSTINANHTFSVHLPDYLDSNTLMDPFSSNEGVRVRSLASIERVMDFAENLAEMTQKLIPVIGSFTGIEIGKNDFYGGLSKLVRKFETHDAILTAQWLPPFAWYFGGSIKLEHLNGIADLEFIERFDIPLTMDISHLFMCTFRNQAEFLEIWERTNPFIRHLHVSDANGLDGEGLQIGEGDPEHEVLFPIVLQNNLIKVLEVWQGHLDNFVGFKRGLKALVKIMDSK